jgi:hypothetical protein
MHSPGVVVGVVLVLGFGVPAPAACATEEVNTGVVQTIVAPAAAPLRSLRRETFASSS